MKWIPVVAACIIHPDASWVLLAKRYSSELPETNNRWEFPGGRMEDNEGPAEALKREIYEELKIKIQVGKILHAQLNRYSDGINYLILFYKCEVEHQSLRKVRNNKILGETVWVWFDEVKKYNPLPGTVQATQTLMEP